MGFLIKKHLMPCTCLLKKVYTIIITKVFHQSPEQNDPIQRKFGAKYSPIFPQCVAMRIPNCLKGIEDYHYHASLTSLSGCALESRPCSNFGRAENVISQC
jgi:hypothetical protein